jgi:hypothetical protein
MDLVSIISAVVGEKLKSLLANLAKEFGDEIKHAISSNILEYQIEEYSRNFCTKTLLHRVQPKALKEFYQPLFISPYPIRSMPQGFKPMVRRMAKRMPTDCIVKLFSEQQFITLIGNAGSGKSTVVKYLFLNAIDTQFKIPIKIELRYLNDYDGIVVDFIKDKIFKLNKLATNDKIIERLMGSGDFVFFLDGYDEITSAKKEKITKEIDELVKLYNKNFYLLTSRPHTEIDLLPFFHNFEVCELSNDDINHFISKQIPSEEEELCLKIIEAVNSKENASYKSFLSNPLLLSMFILTFQSYSSIPQKRNVFYSQVFDALFSVHDSMSKLAFVREKQSGLSKEQIVEVLKLFSFLSYFDEKPVFSGFYLNEKLTLIKEKKRNITFDNDKLITDLQVAIGILNKEGTDYTFPHRSLQEYFAVTYILSLNDDNKKVVYRKIISNLTSKNNLNQPSRDNFHLLLSELDDRGVIRFGLVPYFEHYVAETDPDETDYKQIITSFRALYNVFEAFAFILNSRDTFEANERFNSTFHGYKEKTASKKANSTSEFELRRSRLALEVISPFIKDFIPIIQSKRAELLNYLENQSSIDSDIVSLI